MTPVHSTPVGAAVAKALAAGGGTVTVTSAAQQERAMQLLRRASPEQAKAITVTVDATASAPRHTPAAQQ